MGGTFSRERSSRVSEAFSDSHSAFQDSVHYQQAPDAYFGINDRTVCSRFGRVFQATTKGFETATAEPRNDNGLVITLVVYSLMNGATLHVMPQMYADAGLVVGLVMTTLIAIINHFTCGLIVKIGGASSEYNDFADCVAVFFEESSGRQSVGEAGRYIALLVSVILLMVVCLSYHFVIVKHTMELFLLLDNCGNQNSQIWCHSWFWALVSAGGLLLLMYLRFRIQILLCVGGALCFVVAMVSTVVQNIHEIEWAALSFAPSQNYGNIYYGTNINRLCGVLFISFFIHNIILPVIKSQRNPNTRAVGVGYVGVGLSYAVVGCFGALRIYQQQPVEEPPTQVRQHNDACWWQGCFDRNLCYICDRQLVPKQLIDIVLVIHAWCVE
jgi:hypothetical protein